MNTSQSHLSNQDAYKSPEKLEQEVNQTRARIGERLETLSNRLSPGELLDQVLGMAREHGGEFSRNLGSQVKSNPVPLIITGVGMSWLMMASNSRNYQRVRYESGYDYRRSAAPRYTDGYSDYPYTGNPSSYQTNDYERSMNNDSTEPDVLDKAKEAVGKVGDQVQHLKNSAREKMDRASQTVHQNMASMEQNMRSVQQSARSAQECVTDFLYEQPVLAASLGVALGAAIGALLPATEVEERLLGTASEETLTKAQSLATNQYEKVRETAKEVAENVKQNLQDNAGKQESDAPDSNYSSTSSTTRQG